MMRTIVSMTRVKHVCTLVQCQTECHTNNVITSRWRSRDKVRTTSNYFGNLSRATATKPVSVHRAYVRVRVGLRASVRACVRGGVYENIRWRCVEQYHHSFHCERGQPHSPTVRYLKPPLFQQLVNDRLERGVKVLIAVSLAVRFSIAADDVLVEVPRALAGNHTLQVTVHVVVVGAALLGAGVARVLLRGLAWTVHIRLGKHLDGVVRQVQVRGGKCLDHAVGVWFLVEELVAREEQHGEVRFVCVLFLQLCHHLIVVRGCTCPLHVAVVQIISACPSACMGGRLLFVLAHVRLLAACTLWEVRAATTMVQCVETKAHKCCWRAKSRTVKLISNHPHTYTAHTTLTSVGRDVDDERHRVVVHTQIEVLAMDILGRELVQRVSSPRTVVEQWRRRRDGGSARDEKSAQHDDWRC